MTVLPTVIALESVAERIRHDGQPADRDVERLRHHPPAGRLDRGGRLIGRVDEPVRFITVPGGEDDFRVAGRQGQARLADGVVAPPQLMPEGIAVEAQARVEIWHWDGDRIHLVEQRSG